MALADQQGLLQAECPMEEMEPLQHHTAVVENTEACYLRNNHKGLGLVD